MKPVLLVVASQSDWDGFQKRPIYKSLETLSNLHEEDRMFDYEMVLENKEGLCTVYNSFMDDIYKNFIVVFCHDDIVIQDMHLVESLNEAIQHYNIVGLAGTANFSLKQPVVWHNSPKESWSGAVAHPFGDKISMNSFGTIRKKCIVLDGLFLAFDMEKALSANLKWDEQFKFHFYDLDICVSANQKGLTAGTWDIFVVHHSHGNYDSDEWREGEKKFIEKYKVQK